MGEQNIHSMNILTDKHFLKILPYTVMTNGATMNQTPKKYIHTLKKIQMRKLSINVILVKGI